MKVTRVEFSAPKPVYLKEESDFKTFEETLKPLAEKCLSTDWEWTFKVGGKVQREIEKYEPGSEILVRIKEKKEDGEKGGLSFHFGSPLSTSSSSSHHHHHHHHH